MSCICTRSGIGNAKSAPCISRLHTDLTLWRRPTHKKNYSTGESTKSWEESDVCRLTAKCNNILFKKTYLSSLQGNKNGHICAPFALRVVKMLSASAGRASPPNSAGGGGSAHRPPLMARSQRSPLAPTFMTKFTPMIRRV